MKNHSALTPKGTPLLRIARGDQNLSRLSLSWYYRTRREGRCVYFPLGCSWKEAAARADEIHAFLRLPSSSVTEARARFLAERRRVTDRVATIGEVLECHSEHAGSLDLAPRSVYSYHRSLLGLIRGGLQQRLARKLGDEELKHETTLVLTPRLVIDMKEKALAGLEDVKAILRTKRSVNSLLRNAKSIFSAPAREVYDAERLILPDLAGFLSAQPFRRVSVKYALPSADLIASVMTFITSPQPAIDPNVHLVMKLAAGAGLRISEIRACRRRWLQGGSYPQLRVQAEPDFLPKDGDRSIPLSPELYAELISIDCRDDEHLIKGTQNFRIEEAPRMASKILRDLGLAVGKPLHELRKWFGSQASVRYSLTRAQAWLGHSSHQLTIDYYADLEFPDHLFRFWRAVQFRNR